jgi:hypothetical protein
MFREPVGVDIEHHHRRSTRSEGIVLEGPTEIGIDVMKGRRGANASR